MNNLIIKRTESQWQAITNETLTVVVKDDLIIAFGSLNACTILDRKYRVERRQLAMDGLTPSTMGRSAYCKKEESYYFELNTNVAK